MPEHVDLSRDPLRATCTRALAMHRRRSAQDLLERLATSTYAKEPVDQYGHGGALSLLEDRVRELLGTETARFVVKGTIAQQSMLRAYADRAGCRQVAVHPLSHIDHDEDGAYERLHGIEPVRLGELRPFTAEDLDDVSGPLAAVTVELPLRRAAYRLLPWTELEQVSGWCRDHDVPLHLDGARLWESAAAYGREPHEIAALATTTYVSFYKGIGAMAGCVLAGPEALVEDAMTWAGRHGSSLFAALPYTVGALEGLDVHLPRMPDYLARARALAGALRDVDGVNVVPDPPQTNGFQIHLRADAERVAAAALAIAADEGVWLTSRVLLTERDDTCMLDVSVGDALDDCSDDEVVGWITRLLA